MAKRRIPGRSRTARRGARDNGVWQASRDGLGSVSRMVPGAVDGAGVVAGGLLKLTRSMLVTAVSGAADIGAEALNATVSGVRGVVSAASRMVGEMAGAAQSTFEETVSLAKQLGRSTARRPLAIMGTRPAESPERWQARSDVAA